MNALVLPPYPSTQTRKSLSSSQLATVNRKILSSLRQILALPLTERDSPATRTFVTSYTKDAAFQMLKSLIWKDQIFVSKDDKTIRKLTLLLAENLAMSPAGLDAQTLLDIAIIHGSTNDSQAQPIFISALKSTPSMLSTFESEVVPAFTLLLSPLRSTGLYGLRKTAYCICSLLRVSPAEIIRLFAHNIDFVLALATAYDQGLASIAHSYGGIHVLQQAVSRELDEWERIWIESKVSLMDAFHILFSTMLHDLSAASGMTLTSESERMFDIMFKLIGLPSSYSSSTATDSPSTPFLNRPLLVDYQQSYDMSDAFASALNHADSDGKDAHVDLLESILRTIEQTSHGKTTKKDAGILKLLLRSSGIPSGVENSHNYSPSKVDKGKAKATTSDHLFPNSDSPVDLVDHIDPDIDLKITQVLDILPDQPSSYIRALLTNSACPFRGSVEKTVEALLEGTAPGPGELEEQRYGSTRCNDGEDELLYVKNRWNVFDDEPMDLSRVRVGKKRVEEEGLVLRDRKLIEQMKADIVRRAEEMSDDDDDEDDDSREKKDVNFAFDDDLDLYDAAAVRILGDGEESDGDKEGEEVRKSREEPETILELAYIRDPTLFDRDGQTRRSKLRADLKAQTGWTDEQIEGWKIMLDRNPKKDKILQKHEFAGNRGQVANDNGRIDSLAGPDSSHGSSSSKRGRGGIVRGGRNIGGGAGRGEADDAGRPTGDGGSARDRAWKDKNKASRANHNRKRGHDKKMARVGGPSA